MSAATIVFVEQFYYPEGWGGAQIPRDITVGLCSRGKKVVVVCGRDQYVPVLSGVEDDPREFGVTIRYVAQFLAGSKLRKSLLGQLWFCAAAAVAVINGERPSVIISQTNPPLIVAAISALSRMLRCPHIIIAQDIYPEVMMAHGMISAKSGLGRLLAWVFRCAYRGAERVVSLGPAMSRRLREKGVAPEKIREISNWATGDTTLIRGTDNPVVQAWGLADCFVLLYSGNLGIAHDGDTIVRAVATASANIPELRLIFVGNGARIPETRALARGLGVENLIRFMPYVSIDQLPYTLGIADAALVTLRPAFNGLVVPSKLWGHMARGIATIYIGPEQSDVAEILEQSGGGCSVRNGEVTALATMLQRLASNRELLTRMGRAANVYYRKHLSREIAMLKYNDLIDSLTKRK